MPYAFTLEDFNKFSEDILKAEGDQATLTTLLADMNGTITDAIAKDTANTEKVNTVTAENERLKNANMTLFLRVGQQADETPSTKEAVPDEHKPSSTAAYMQSYFDRLEQSKGGK